MKITRRAGLSSLVGILLGACAVPAHDPPGARWPAVSRGGAASLVVQRGEDPASAARTIADLARSADVVYLGEQHDNPQHHANQRAVLDALAARDLRPAVAFEMLEAGQQAAVDRALAETTAMDTIDERLGWSRRGWPSFAMYWPLFDIATRAGWPVVALDLDPTMSRRIARGGLASLGREANGLGSLLPPDPAREADIARAMRDAHCGLLPEARVPTIVEAWHARNVTMARRLAAALDRGRPVVVIVGRGHQAPGGLPDQLAALRPGTRQVVVDMVEESEDVAAEAPRSGAPRVVWRTPPVERGDPCAALRQPPR